MLLPFVWMTGMHMSPEHVEGVPAVVAATAARSAAVRVDKSAVWLRTVSRRLPTWKVRVDSDAAVRLSRASSSGSLRRLRMDSSAAVIRDCISTKLGK